MKVWIARDGEKDGNNKEPLYLWMEQPEYTEDWIGGKVGWFWDNQGEMLELDQTLYPEIKNGTCVEAEIVLKGEG